MRLGLGFAMLVALNKPFAVLCQFSDRGAAARRTLSDFVHPAAPTGGGQSRAPGQASAGRRQAPGTDRWRSLYPAGRLDFDSEGLVLLTDDGALAHRLTDPRQRRAKTYFVQVEGVVNEAALEKLRKGVILNDGPTLPAGVRLLSGAPSWLWPRDPPVRYRRTVPDAWLELTLRGRNRQVRRMTAAVGLPTLRLIRTQVGEYALDGLTPGTLRVVSE